MKQLGYLFAVFKANMEAAYCYKPQRYSGKLSVFYARENIINVILNRTLGWKKFAVNGIETHEIPGDHHTMIQKPHVLILARKLTHCMNNAQEIETGSMH